MKTLLQRSLIVLLLQMLSTSSPPTQAAVAVLNPVADGAGTDQPKDGIFDSFFPANSVYLVGGQPDADYRSVVEFSLASIPAGSTITSAKLQLHAVAGV